ncbi:hypothetical protein H0H81_002836 [Sphagnurus paluster]|uniref:Uncharacterized protein n=1 Tax=Sphagnurus paluster TaxID=117069 RepID=A0A9P7K5M0_9AGAR|nr:hypothetical protein H0H81_002836 [Sphagnurus paluster]
MALSEPGSHRGNSGNAAIAGLTEMTPRMIAYVAVQDKYESKKHLEFFNNEVFGSPTGAIPAVDTSPDGDDDETNDFALAIKQRTEKRARLADDDDNDHNDDQSDGA